MNRKWMLSLALVLILASSLACGLTGFGTFLSERQATPPPAEAVQIATPIVVVATPSPAQGGEVKPVIQVDVEEQLVIGVYARVSPAVVCVTAPQRLGECVGSGFVIDRDGHIVTNNHVAEAADRLLVTLADDRTVSAEVVGVDPDSDLAVLRIDVPADELTPVELGESATLRVGQRAIAIGNPFGLERTLTTGIISSLGRTLPRDDSDFQLAEVIQTDAAINPGNSGGPLLDSQGRVIGVNTAIRSNSGTNSGVGFAIPVDAVKRVVPELISHGRYRHPWLGVSGSTIALEMVEAGNLPVNQGVLISTVEPGSPSDNAGLRGGDRQVSVSGIPMVFGGDIIVGINGAPVIKFEDIVNFLASQTSVGDVITLTVVRGSNHIQIDVTLEERPPNR